MLIGLWLSAESPATAQNQSSGSRSTRKSGAGASTAAGSSEDANNRKILAKLDQVLDNQQKILAKFDEVMEELRIIKIRATLR